MFEITDSVSFYRKMLEEYDDFVEDPNSSRHAVNCALSAYHIAEWIWGDWLGTDYETWKELGIRDRQSFLTWVDTAQPWFKIVQGIANGSKHFSSKLAATRLSGSYVDDGYVESGYQSMNLEVEVEKDRWIEAVIVMEEVVIFWKNFFMEYGPAVKLPKPRNPLTIMPD